ncbi:MAG: electron transfer flavoprotein subunit alpha/FixB family protein [Elusimicrobia bacterium]|nr:electron transfer flavoprotein subunit alpha/FixB family protein [Elusimicrobiota bacterium]
MKVLLVGEYREGQLLESCFELEAFADELKAERATLLVGSADACQKLRGKVYFADAADYLEYNPDLHKRLVLEAAARENADHIVFSHSAYGWDLAPRVAAALKAGQVSDIIAVRDGKFEVGCLNGKMRRLVAPATAKAVLTLQPGAFTLKNPGPPEPRIEKLDVEKTASPVNFLGYEPAEKKEVDLTKAAIIVGAGRGIGKQENLAVISALAEALHAEVGASRPVVDAGWLDHSRQVGSTGQVVSPKLYLACGISGATQHLTGMRKSGFIVAINKDKEAPISELADVLVIADLIPFAAALTARLKKP